MLTKKAVAESNEKLKEAIDGFIEHKGKKLKGHVICDLYESNSHKVDGFDSFIPKKVKEIVEAKYALHINTHYKTTNKLYIVV